MEVNIDLIEALEALKGTLANVINHLRAAINTSPKTLVALQIPSDSLEWVDNNTITKEQPSAATDWINRDECAKQSTSNATGWVDLPNANDSVWFESEKADLIPPPGVKVDTAVLKEDLWIDNPMGWLEEEVQAKRLRPIKVTYVKEIDGRYEVNLRLWFSPEHRLKTSAVQRNKKLALRIAALDMAREVRRLRE